MPAVQRKVKPPVEALKNVGFDDVLERLEAQERPYDRDLLSSVYAYTERMHQDQLRKSGEPYVTHPTYVAYLLADLKFDQLCVAVGLLHDVLEDTLTSKDELEARFGREIAELVDGVTKIGQQQYVRRDEAQAETFRKMILASAKDLRVILVKLADRLHNMLTLAHMSEEARRRISRETLEIYAPIAHRLGMSRVKRDLEDLAFYHLYTRHYAELETQIRQKMRDAKGQIGQFYRQLEARLEAAGLEAEISYRVKHHYSIYCKLQRQGIDISRLYDFLAFRIVTETKAETYAALGVVHEGWRPIPGRFKDYIAMPKPNLYQSLHTTVVTENGQPVEVQIRTREMHRVAEEGIAAHWGYKEGKTEASGGDVNIGWLRQLLDWQQEVEDPRTFLATLKIDLYPDEVYVFTPKGDVRAFPRGATPLDFAYRIHTDLGHQCSGARVNGKLVPIRTRLQNGDMVEILTSPNRQPSRDWLNYVVTSRAKSKIRQWLNTQQKQESEAIGRRMLEKHLKRLRVSVKKTLESPAMESYLKAEGLPRIEDLFQRLGYGKTPVRQVIDKVLEPEQIEAAGEAPEPSLLRRAVDRILPSTSGPVLVKGEGDVLTYLAKCCNPLPGEEVVGYVTRGRGVSVHSIDCPNVRNMLYDPEREIEVEWASKSSTRYPVSLLIKTEDHPGMLARLTEAIAKESSNIRSFEAEAVETGQGVIGVVVEVKNSRHLTRLQRALGNLPGVIQVTRRRLGAQDTVEEPA